MEVLFLLIPLSILLVSLVAALLIWAVRSGQFEDLDGAGSQILMDDDAAADTAAPVAADDEQ